MIPELYLRSIKKEKQVELYLNKILHLFYTLYKIWPEINKKKVV